MTTLQRPELALLVSQSVGRKAIAQFEHDFFELSNYAWLQADELKRSIIQDIDKPQIRAQILDDIRSRR